MIFAKGVINLLSVITFTLVILGAAIEVKAEERLSESVVEHVRTGVVQVIAISSDTIPRRSATGFRWHSPDLVVTSYHVVAGADSVVVQTTAGGVNATDASLVAVDLASDLALLKMKRTLPGMPLRHSSAIPSVPMPLWVAGFPLEVAGLRSRKLSMSDIAPRQLREALDATARRDLVSVGFPYLDQEVLHLEGDLLPGDSGAPILDKFGRVVAIGNGGLKLGQVGLGWAIPAAKLDTLMQKGLNDANLSLSALQSIQTSFFSRVSPERIDETLWETASQLNTLEAYRDYLDRYPAGTFATTAKARLNDMEKRYKRAIDYYRKAMEYQTLLGVGGDVSAVREAHDRIESNLKRAIENYPTFEAAHFELGRNQYLKASLLNDSNSELEAYKEAIDIFNNAIDLYPESAEAYLFRGFAYANISDYRYACEDYVNFQRLKHTLSPSKFEHHRQQHRFSRDFLEYHGCDIPTDLKFTNSEDLRRPEDRNNVERDCRPNWWEGEAEYCALKGSTEAMVRLADRISVLAGSVKFLSIEETMQAENAVRWADELAQRGDPRGAYYLGYMYLNGFGKPRIPELAFSLMRKAADGNYSEAFGSLGLMYLDGLFVKRNLSLARSTWARGAVLEDSYSKSSLESFEFRKQSMEQESKLSKDFLNILKRASGSNYTFSVRNELALRYEEAARSFGDDYLLSSAIDQLAGNKELAPKSVPLMVDKYPLLKPYIQQRIRIAFERLRYGTPEAAQLMADEIFSVNPAEDGKRINLSDDARLRHEALLALAAFGPVSGSVVNRILPLLNSKDRHIRLLVLAVIGKAGKPELHELIEKMTHDKSLMVRFEADRLLSKISSSNNTDLQVPRDATKKTNKKLKTFSTKDLRWQVWTNRQSVRRFAYSHDKKKLWVGTSGGLEKRRANDGKIEAVFTTATGLPQNHVHSLMADEIGGIWVGTSNGLGYLSPNDDWKTWNSKNSILKSPFGAQVNAISSDGSGGVWLGVGRNIYHLEESGNLIKIESQYLERGSQGDITDIEYDDKGGIWISTWGNGLLHYDFQNSTWNFFEKYSSSKLDSHIPEIAADGNGGAWVAGTEGSIIHVKSNKKDFELLKLPASRFSGVPSHIETLYVDEDRKLWVSMRDGSVAYLENKVWKIFSSLREVAKKEISNTPFNLRAFLGFPTAKAIISDMRGGVWLGTNEFGLIHLTGDDKLGVLTGEIGMQKGEVQSLASDRQNGIWIGTDRGFAHLDENGDWETFNERGDHSDRLIATSLNGQRIWVATSSEIRTFSQKSGWKQFEYYKSARQLYGDIEQIAPDSSDGLWIRTLSSTAIVHVSPLGEFSLVADDSEVIPGWIKSFAPDGRGGIWVLSYKNKVNFSTHIHSKNQIEGPYRMEGYDDDYGPNSYISDSDGGVWLASSYYEIFHMKEDQNNRSFSFSEYSFTNSCLPRNRQFLSLAAAGEEVWVGTMDGLVHFSVNTGQCSLFELGSGIPDLAIKHLLLDNASIWIGTDSGMGRLQF
jgi:ligand-binding sensor domain-containing protein